MSETSIKKHIAIFQSDLQVGGIQRSLVNLLWLLSGSDQFDIDVFIFDQKTPFYDISRFSNADNIHLYFLSALPYFNRFIPFAAARRLWTNTILNQIKSNKEYDLSVDFNSYWNECAIAALSVPSRKKICFIHNDVKIKLKEEWKYRLLHFFFHNKYHHFDEMAAVSHAISTPFYEVNKHAPKVCTVVPNSINTEEIFTKIGEACDILIDNSRFNFVSVGHLHHQKGYDILFNHIYNLKRNHPNEIKNAHFTILGDGSLRDDLEKQISALGLDELITLAGYVNNPFPVLIKCDAFTMTSRYEGQPLAFWEAKACGLKVIIPKHLEAYTGGIKGCEDFEYALLQTISEGKYTKNPDSLADYNSNIKNIWLQL